MTLKEISDMEQYAAHHTRFCHWWHQNIWPLLQQSTLEEKNLSFETHWIAWKRRHDLKN